MKTIRINFQHYKQLLKSNASTRTYQNTKTINPLFAKSCLLSNLLLSGCNSSNITQMYSTTTHHTAYHNNIAYYDDDIDMYQESLAFYELMEDMAYRDFISKTKHEENIAEEKAIDLMRKLLINMHTSSKHLKNRPVEPSHIDSKDIPFTTSGYPIALYQQLADNRKLNRRLNTHIMATWCKFYYIYKEMLELRSNDRLMQELEMARNESREFFTYENSNSSSTCFTSTSTTKNNTNQLAESTSNIFSYSTFNDLEEEESIYFECTRRGKLPSTSTAASNTSVSINKSHTAAYNFDTSDPKAVKKFMELIEMIINTTNPFNHQFDLNQIKKHTAEKESTAIAKLESAVQAIYYNVEILDHILATQKGLPIDPSIKNAWDERRKKITNIRNELLFDEETNIKSQYINQRYTDIYNDFKYINYGVNLFAKYLYDTIEKTIKPKKRNIFVRNIENIVHKDTKHPFIQNIQKAMEQDAYQLAYLLAALKQVPYTVRLYRSKSKGERLLNQRARKIPLFDTQIEKPCTYKLKQLYIQYFAKIIPSYSNFETVLDRFTS